MGSIQRRRKRERKALAASIAAETGVEYVDMAGTSRDAHRTLLDSGARAVIATGGGLCGIAVVTRFGPEMLVGSAQEARMAMAEASACEGRVHAATALASGALRARGLQVLVVDDFDMQDDVKNSEVVRRQAEGRQAVIMTGFPTVMYLFRTSFNHARVKPDPLRCLAIVYVGASYMPITVTTEVASINRWLDTKDQVRTDCVVCYSAVENAATSPQRTCPRCMAVVCWSCFCQTRLSTTPCACCGEVGTYNCPVCREHM